MVISFKVQRGNSYKRATQVKIKDLREASVSNNLEF